MIDDDIRRRRALVLFWGRDGAGWRLAHELTTRWPVDTAILVEDSVTVLAGTAADPSEDRARRPRFLATPGRVRAMLELGRDTAALRRLLRSGRYETVLLPMENIVGQAALLLTRAHRRATVVVGIHDAVPHDGDPRTRIRVMRYLSLRLSSQVVAFSNATASLIAQGHPDVTVRTARLGSLPVASDEPPRPAATSDDVCLGFFGRLLPYKGLDRLVDAFLELRARYPSITCRIVGNGDITSCVPPDRLALARRTGLELDVRWVPEERVADVLRTFDICVLPYREASQSGVVGQAASLGVPVVATPVGGLREQVEDLGGIVCDDTSTASLVAAIAALVDDPEQCAELADRARLAAARTSVEVMARDLAAILSTIEAVSPAR